jgi:hypothetical protein
VRQAPSRNSTNAFPIATVNVLDSSNSHSPRRDDNEGR